MGLLRRIMGIKKPPVWLLLCCYTLLYALYHLFVQSFDLPRSLLALYVWVSLFFVLAYPRVVIWIMLAIYWGLAIPGMAKEATSAVFMDGFITISASTLFVVLLTEITQRVHLYYKELNRELEIASAKAEDAVISKSMFLANMSHEIRTPLSGIKGLSEMLLEHEDREQQRRHIALISESAEGLMHIVNTVLDFSKAEAKRLPFFKESFSPTALVESVVEGLSVAAQKKSLALYCECKKSLPPLVLCDPHRLRQVLVNLLANAIKYTPAGNVSISIKLSDQRLVCTVRDTGIGIAEELLPKIFTPFEQVSSTYTRSSEGTGLGLAIVKEIIDQAGGEITVESEVGVGSVFTFTMPVELAEVVEVKETNIGLTHFKKKGLRVLVAEDNKTNQVYITHLMKKVGCVPTLVENGEEAVELFRTEEFDIVLMDVQMPVLSGVDATRAIRVHEQSERLVRTPIIALTACTSEFDRSTAMDAGIDHFCTKPVDLNTLLTCMHDSLGISSS